MSWKEFRLVRKGKGDLVWMIKQEGESYETQHGQLNGKLQKNTDTPGSKGKENTKAYVDAEANCAWNIEREIRKKTECGYIQIVNGKLLEEPIVEINFDKYLPKIFCSYKPQSSITEKAHNKIYKEGHARYTRKYDGQMHLAVHHTWGWEIYTRRMDLATDRFPHHIKQLEQKAIYPGTILVGEMVCQDEDGCDNFKNISRVCRSDAPKVRKLIEDKEVPEPIFIIFDSLFYNKEDLQTQTYDRRSGYWKWDFPALRKRSDEDYICRVDFYQLTPDNWEETAKENNWEGFVVVDGKAAPGDRFYTFTGKPKRPKGTYKLKPIWEIDAVVFAATRGTGKRRELIGAVYAKQKGADGKYFSVGKCGSGFDDDEVEEMLQLCLKNDIPILNKEKEIEDLDLEREEGLFTIEIKHFGRIAESNKLRHAVFNRLRFDKDPEECYMEGCEE